LGEHQIPSHPHTYWEEKYERSKQGLKVWEKRVGKQRRDPGQQRVVGRLAGEAGHEQWPVYETENREGLWTN
jgi:hypothetical protein